MTRVTFGTKASPFLLNAALQHHLKTVEGPLAGTADLLSQSFYVDDLLVGAPKDREAVKLFYEANDMIEAAGMKLRKWASNSQYLRKLFVACEGCLSSETVKILGLLWNPEKDLITVATKAVQGLSDMKSDCKRYVLQVIARIFDPLGLLAPFTVGAKFIFQELWQRGVGWDDDLPSDLEKQWTNWRYELPQLGGITVDRCVVSDQHSKSVQLHVFCDASQRAYGACAYLRVEDLKGHVHSTLVFSKSRIAPLKTMTLPRLELMAALLGSRITTFLKDCFYGLLEVSQIVYWTDSSITLHWLRGNPAQWNEFVQHRVAEVQSCTDKTQWRHCPGYENPADRLTRGTSLNYLSTDNLWWSGSLWLVKDSHDWPAATQNAVLFPSEVDLELKKEAKILHVKVLKQILELSRYSRLGRVLRVTAWVFRFIAKARGATTTTFSTTTAEEVTTAEEYWIKTVQEETYGEEIAELRLGHHLDIQSKTSKFHPMLDSTGCFV